MSNYKSGANKVQCVPQGTVSYPRFFGFYFCYRGKGWPMAVGSRGTQLTQRGCCQKVPPAGNNLPIGLREEHSYLSEYSARRARRSSLLTNLSSEKRAV